MDDPCFVGGFEGFGDLLGDRECFVEGNSTLRNAISRRRPFDVFENQRASLAGFFQSVNLGNVRMVQGGENLGFSLKSG